MSRLAFIWEKIKKYLLTRPGGQERVRLIEEMWNHEGMSRQSVLWAIFALYLYLFSKPAAGLLLKEYEKEAGGGDPWHDMARLFAADAEALRVRIERGGDEEHVIPYLNMFLWKQKHGEILSSARLTFDFLQRHNALLIHRNMVANGYEGIENLAIPVEAGVSTYKQEIKRYLGFFNQPTGYDDDDYFSYLAQNLNVIGPRFRQYDRLSEVHEFAEYLLAHLSHDQRLQWLDPVAFTMLMSDLEYPAAKTWAAYQHLLQRDPETIGGIFFYPALLLGIRMYGDLARQELQRLEIAGGYELLNTLAST